MFITISNLFVEALGIRPKNLNLNGGEAKTNKYSGGKGGDYKISSYEATALSKFQNQGRLYSSFAKSDSATTRSACAAIVSAGFMAADEGKKLASMT